MNEPPLLELVLITILFGLSELNSLRMKRLEQEIKKLKEGK